MNSTSINCTPPAILEFPTILTDKPPRYDFAAIAIFASIYLFLALAIVCDKFFVPAVERLCYKLNMTYDIAGATFMAAATSAPEFFIQTVGTFITKDDLGIGTILGSSVFNTLAVPAVCGIFSGVTISLDWWPLTRDTIWYIISVTTLTCLISDGIIDWRNSTILVILYAFNLANLVWDRSIQRFCRFGEKPCLPCFVPTGEVPDLVGTMNSDPQEGTEEEIFRITGYPKKESYYNKLMWLISWPIELLFLLTIPDCRRISTREWYWFSLFNCIAWISLLSYLISWTMTVVGFNFFIPDSIMGITFLAAGTSIPEAIGSLAVVRKGYGSMFICNCISSNTFDILICLGVPWLLKCLFNLDRDQTGVHLNSSGIFVITASLIITSFVLYTAFMFTRFTMQRVVGWLLLLGYIAYVLFACAIEFNLFGPMNMPTCLYEEQ